MLSNIYFRTVTFDNVKNEIKIVMLNSSHFKKELGKYLLQNRYKSKIDGNYVQEAMSIYLNKCIKEKEKDKDKINIGFISMSIIWNYDGYSDKVWYTVSFANEDLNLKTSFKEKIENEKDIFGDFEEIDERFVFTTKGNCVLFH